MSNAEKKARTFVIFHFFSFYSWGGVRLSPLGTLATIWPIIPTLMMDDDECGAVCGMNDKGNQSTPIKSASVPLCPP
jgi:hypothetical protein